MISPPICLYVHLDTYIYVHIPTHTKFPLLSATKISMSFGCCFQFLFYLCRASISLPNKWQGGHRKKGVLCFLEICASPLPQGTWDPLLKPPSLPLGRVTSTVSPTPLRSCFLWKASERWASGTSLERACLDVQQPSAGGNLPSCLS